MARVHTKDIRGFDPASIRAMREPAELAEVLAELYEQLSDQVFEEEDTFDREQQRVHSGIARAWMGIYV